MKFDRIPIRTALALLFTLCVCAEAVSQDGAGTDNSWADNRAALAQRMQAFEQGRSRDVPPRQRSVVQQASWSQDAPQKSGLREHTTTTDLRAVPQQSEMNSDTQPLNPRYGNSRTHVDTTAADERPARREVDVIGPDVAGQLDSFDPMRAMIQMVMGTTIVLCLVVGALLLAKRWLPKSLTEAKLPGFSAGRLHVVSTLALSNKAQVKVVSTGSQMFLVGLDATGLKSIAPLTSFDDVLEHRTHEAEERTTLGALPNNVPVDRVVTDESRTTASETRMPAPSVPAKSNGEFRLSELPAAVMEQLAAARGRTTQVSQVEANVGRTI